MMLKYDCKKLDYYNLNDITFTKEDSYISQIDDQAVSHCDL